MFQSLRKTPTRSASAAENSIMQLNMNVYKLQIDLTKTVRWPVPTKMTSYRLLSAAKTRQSTAIDVKRELHTPTTFNVLNSHIAYCPSISFANICGHIFLWAVLQTVERVVS